MKYLFLFSLLLQLISLDAWAADRHDFTIKSVQSWLSNTGHPPSTSHARVNRNIHTLYMLPIIDPDRTAILIRWELNSLHQGTDYGNALMNKVTSTGTVRIQSSVSANTGYNIRPSRKDNIVTAVIRYPRLRDFMQGDRFVVSLIVPYNRSTTVYSRSSWEPTIQLSVKPLPSPRVSFTRLLKSTFEQQKCLGCHAFQSNSTGNRHVQQGRIPNRFRATISNVRNCSGCHNSGNGFADSWHAPVGLDWTGMSASGMVNLITAESPFNTKAGMKHHLKEDVLIKWAIDEMPIRFKRSWRRKTVKWVKSWQGSNHNP